MADVIIDLGSLTAEQGFTILGDLVETESGDFGLKLGYSVSDVGDVNGDGFTDVIVGAPGYNGGGDGYSSGVNNGQAYVVYGTANGTRQNIDLANFTATDGFVLRGDDYGYGNAGFSVTGGDINGDGLSDLIVASPSLGAAEISPEGTVYVVYGVRGATRPDVDLGAPTPGQGFIITGGADFDQAGHSVSTAGDFNGDGVGDLLIGAPYVDFASSNDGSAYLIFGQRGTARGNIDLGALASTDGFTLHYESDGGYDYAYAGFSVSGRGDINGDGFADLIFGAPYESVGSFYGQVHVIFGEAGSTHPDVNLANIANGFSVFSSTDTPFSADSVANAGDVNGDGYDDILIASDEGDDDVVGHAKLVFYNSGGPLEVRTFFTDASDEETDYSVSAAGDVNGDGFGDIIIGVLIETDYAADDNGKVYIVYGNSDPARIAVDLDNLTADQGFAVDLSGVNDADSLAVSAAGDINGDGYDDVIIGVPNSDSDYAGAAYVVYGFTRDTNWIRENASPVMGNVLRTIPHPGAPDGNERGDVGDVRFTLGNPFLELRDSSDTLLRSDNDGGDSLNALIEEFTAPSDGTYYLGASGADNTTGTYRVHAVKVSDAPDDFAGDVATKGAVTAAAATTGNLEVTGDTDWFKVTLTGGTRYRFDVKGSSTGNGTLSDPYLELRDANGNVVLFDDNDGSGSNAEISLFSPPGSGGGTYFLAVSSANGGKGTYTVSTATMPFDDFAGDMSTNGAVAVGGSKTGFVNFAGDSDWFTIELEAGAAYQLDLTSNDSVGSSDPFIEIRDFDGTKLDSNDNFGGSFNARIASFVAPSSGLYHVTAQASPGKTLGSYTLSTKLIDDFGNDTVTSGSVSTGGQTAGNLETPGDQDWFSIFLDKGATYNFDLDGGDGTGSLTTPLLELHDASGVTKASASGTGDAQITKFTALESGNYYLAARSSTTGGTGTYQVSADLLDDHGATGDTAGTIAAGETRTGRIETANDMDWFAVELTAGQKYTFDAANTDTFNPIGRPALEIYNDSGKVVVGDPGGTTTTTQIADFIAPNTGTFFLSASSGIALGYRVSVTGPDDFAATAATIGTVAVGGSTTGNIEVSGDNDWFAVNLTKGTKYVFDVKGTATGNGSLGDPTLELRDATGALIKSDNDKGFGTNAEIWGFIAPTTGKYFLAAGGNGSTGTYTVSAAGTAPDDFAGSAATKGTVGIDGFAKGNVETSGDSDWFGVTLEEGATYTFELEGDPGQPVVTSTGTFNLDFGRLTLSADGSYTYALYTKTENPTAWQTVRDLGSTDRPLIDDFEYTYKIGATAARSTVAVTVFGVDNNPPVAVDDIAATDEDTAITIDVRFNDSDPDGDKTVITGTPTISQGLGSVSVVNDQLVYNPSPAYNSLPQNATATVVIDYTIADPSGETASAKATVTVTGVNDVATIGGANTGSVTEDAAAILTTSGGLTVTDPDAGEASFQAQAGTKGTYGTFSLDTKGSWSYSADNSQTAIQALGVGETATEKFQVKSLDGTADTVTVTIIGVNDLPIVPPVQPVTTEQNKVSGAVTIGATDIDGDTLKYSASTGPTKGSVSFDQTNGTFTYLPATGFVGFDSFILVVDDSNGGVVTTPVTVTVFPPQPGPPLIDNPVPQGGLLNPTPGSAGQVEDARFRLIAADGFAGAVQGSGEVFGTNGFQQVSVLERSGSVTFDGSFARGGDVVRLAGAAAGYTIAVAGSNAVLTHGPSEVTIPLGAAGVALVFDDGARWLGFDAAAGGARIGSQAFGESPAQITALADNTRLPTDFDLTATARLVLEAEGEVGVSGNVSVFGSNGAEQLHLFGGSVTLDGSFARGGDTLFLTGEAKAYSAYLAGTSVMLTGDAGGTFSVPVGGAGLVLDFAGDDDRTLRFDLTSASVLIGDQTITAISLAGAQHLEAFAFA